jgi:hypothetical protein
VVATPIWETKRRRRGGGGFGGRRRAAEEGNENMGGRELGSCFVLQFFG